MMSFVQDEMLALSGGGQILNAQERDELGDESVHGGDVGGTGRGVQLRQPIVPGRRDRQTSDNRDDPIEFEGPQCARVHQ